VGVDRVSELEDAGIRVLSVSRHSNKLRPGHLRGNRFNVIIRGVDQAAAKRVSLILERLRREGLPNYYGPQRFGHGGETVRLGLDLLYGKAEPRRHSPFLRRLALSAAQSALFNHYLAERWKDGLSRQVLAGDVLAKWPFGGLFVAMDPGREQARLETREVVPTGPIFGRKMMPARDLAAAREASVLADAGLSTAAFFGFGKLLQGTRRHALVYIDEMAAFIESDAVRTTFTLPAGSYATVLLREIMKVPALDTEEPAS
jgi:tRNA pseudouridine13 synthase